jgi:predicted amidophosphoribosyltransferase
VLQQLDALSSQDGRVALEAEIEAKVLALRQAQAVPGSASQQSIDRFCSQCGQQVDPEDRFCASCGTSLKGTASQ